MALKDPLIQKSRMSGAPGQCDTCQPSTSVRPHSVAHGFRCAVIRARRCEQFVPRYISINISSVVSVKPSKLKSYQLEPPPLNVEKNCQFEMSVSFTSRSSLPSPGQA